MLECVGSIDRRAVAAVMFVTLTVPTGEADWQSIERHRSAWVKRFVRKWGKLGWFMIWKKEHHKSGTPHLHALVFWIDQPPALSAFRHWNDRAWARVVKSMNPHHQRVGCRVEMMQGWNGVTHYCSKYLAKDQEGLIGDTGRIWGIVRRSMMPVSVRVVQLSPAVGKKVRRALLKLQQRKRRRWLVKFDGKWQALRAQFEQVKIAGGRWRRGRLLQSVDDLVHSFSVAGIRLKQMRPRCLVNRKVPVWVECSERPGRVEKFEDETHAFCSSLHFVEPVQVDRLVTFFQSQSAADDELGASVPF
jgi:hypothetical protein